MMDEEYRDKALKWVLANSFKKESPNLRAAHFRIWANDILLTLVVQYHSQVKQQISVSTATWWFHILGFQPLQSHKDVYIDGYK